ncbi:phosphopeptide-binding protein [Roseivirga sp. BDSF3-8]|uniref:phosphopeptide-binding protein n=1 Tax=Roseivirga sp. BDSF3-8 TaxID=3241598 RepID=UPI0035321E38
MKLTHKLLLGLFSFALFTACENTSNSGQEGEEETMNDSTETMAEDQEQSQLSLTPFTESAELMDAKLEWNEPAGDVAQAGDTQFGFNVTNYELGVPTEGSENIGIAKSDKGQHIHLILNNEPYYAIYEPDWTTDLADDDYVALAFLSRSYHESVKNPDAFVVKHFKVGNADTKDVDLTAPHMFYSRPKGEYTGADTQKVLLDFYLVNTDLSADGNKVRATINGEEFMIDEWQPYLIEGMPMGENTIRLELLDSQGNAVPGPFNDVTRTVTLKEAM